METLLVNIVVVVIITNHIIVILKTVVRMTIPLINVIMIPLVILVTVVHIVMVTIQWHKTYLLDIFGIMAIIMTIPPRPIIATPTPSVLLENVLGQDIGMDVTDMDIAIMVILPIVDLYTHRMDGSLIVHIVAKVALGVLIPLILAPPFVIDIIRCTLVMVAVVVMLIGGRTRGGLMQDMYAQEVEVKVLLMQHTTVSCQDIMLAQVLGLHHRHAKRPEMFMHVMEMTLGHVLIGQMITLM